MGTKEIKCVLCGKEASYIFLGDSYCEDCFKKRREEIRQVLAEQEKRAKELEKRIEELRKTIMKEAIKEERKRKGE